MGARWIVTGLSLLALGLLSAGAADAGSVRIEDKTEVLKWVLEKEAVIHTPVFHGIKDPVVRKRLQESIAAGVREDTGSSPEEWKTEGDGWLTGIDYEVPYNRNGLLSLAYKIEGLGPYPDHMEAYVLLDLKTGRRLTAKDLFRAGLLQDLAAKVDRMRASAVEKAVKEHRVLLKEWEMTEEDLEVIMEPAKQSRFGVENLDRFRLGDKGITFVYDFDFPHVSEALEPVGEYFVSYKELRPFVKPEGPLARVVR
jgi:hypothetical protein